ncbi:hypothetical protein TELCIR_13139, partial [Teladorsagia circumcincta]
MKIGVLRRKGIKRRGWSERLLGLIRCGMGLICIYIVEASMKRRVTVHFGDVRVVVPCLHEDTTVADLAEAAIIRYKKATGK